MCSKCPSWAHAQTSGCHCSKTGDRTGNTKAVFCMARLSPSGPQPAMARLQSQIMQLLQIGNSVKLLKVLNSPHGNEFHHHPIQQPKIFQLPLKTQLSSYITKLVSNKSPLLQGVNQTAPLEQLRNLQQQKKLRKKLDRILVHYTQWHISILLLNNSCVKLILISERLIRLGADHQPNCHQL